MANTQEYGASITASLEELAAGGAAYDAALALKDAESHTSLTEHVANELVKLEALEGTTVGAIGALAEEIGDRIEDAATKVVLGRDDFMTTTADSHSPYVDTARRAISTATRQVTRPADSGVGLVREIMEKSEIIDGYLQAARVELLAIQGLAEQLCGDNAGGSQEKMRAYLGAAGASMQAYGQQLGIDIAIPPSIQSS